MFLSFMGHCVMENRNALVVASVATQATGRSERDAVFRRAGELSDVHEKTIGADKG